MEDTNQQLTALVERIERLEEEKKAIAGDVKDVYAEAKSTGFDVKILRQIIKLRKKSSEERMEEEAILDLYMVELGMKAKAVQAEMDRVQGVA